MSSLDADLDVLQSSSPSKEGFTPEQKKIVYGLVLANLARNMGGQINDFLLAWAVPNLFNGDSGIYGWVYSVFSLSQFIWMFPFAKWSDSIGRRPLMILSFVMFTIGAFLCGFATTLWQLFLFRFIQGASAFAGVALALINDYFPPGKRGKPIAYFSASLAGGYLIGSLLGATVISTCTYQEAFNIISFLSFISLIFVILFIHDKPRSRDENSSKVPSSSPRFTPESSQNHSQNRSHIRKFVWEHKELRKCFIIAGLRQFTYQGIITYLFYLILNYFDKGSRSSNGYFLFPVILSYIVSLVLLGHYEKPLTVLRIGSVLLTIGLGIMSLAVKSESLLLVVFVGILDAIFLGMIMPSMDNYVSHLTPEKYRGELLGFYKGFLFFLGLFGPITIGTLGAKTSAWMPFLFLMGLMFYISILINFRLGRS